VSRRELQKRENPEITSSAFGEDELEEQLRIDAMQRKREEEQKKMGAQQMNRPPMDQ
jgi:hypothetical protein